MLGVTTPRYAELSRHNHPNALEDYARLEYPHEEARAVLEQALAAGRSPSVPAARSGGWLRRLLGRAGGTPAKA